MITKDGALYVTVAIDRGGDGSIRVLLPGYANRIHVHPDSGEDGGHSRLHGGLSYLLDEHAAEESE